MNQSGYVNELKINNRKGSSIRKNDFRPYEDTMSRNPYNDAQWRAVAFIPRVTGLLSFIGSSLIIKVIMSSWKTKLKTPYHRILLCMSIMDVISSTGHLLSTSPIPSDSVYVYGAAGNVYTCTIQGVILTLGFAVPLYNLSLSFHYLLSTINQCMKSKLEPIYHFVSLGFPFSMAVIGIINENFNNVGSICFLNAYPTGCEKNPKVECTRGLSAKYQRNIFAIVIFCCYGIITLNMFLLFFSVRYQHRKIDRKYSGPFSNRNESFKKK